ncbi:MAG TPA: isochorismate synthase [Bacillota bacterium]|nr:isochorismate synthase [Bacillota bacterium]
MIRTDVMSLQDMINRGIERAHTTVKEVLVSYTEKVTTEDPFLVFERARALKQNRTFWKSATEDFYVITVGENMHIRAHDKTRYEYTYQTWDHLRKEAMIYNPYEQEGTGLIISGGMSFDILEEKTKLWEKYPHSEFIVPKYVYTKQDDHAYVTTIIQVTKDSSAEELAEKSSQSKKQLLTKQIDDVQQARLTEQTEKEPELWKEKVGQAIDHINCGHAEKIVMARELRLTFDADVELLPILRKLAKLQRTSYLFAYERGDHCFIGATPERLVKVNGHQLLSTCLAGTYPRGESKEEDDRLKRALFEDDKNRLEHDHVVQMIRDSISAHCMELHIPDEPEVIRLKNVHHLYTPVEGELKKDSSVFDIIQKLHPTPALGGAPTEEALHFIREHETFERGWYGSPVGWLDDRHNGEFAVAIRSGLIQNDEMSLFAGCGVMGDSDVEEEYEETAIKFLPMLTALED